VSIEFNCPSCEKSIRAPDTAGGRYGKCPFCDVKVYIPSAPSDEGEIGLAPIDAEEEKREQELIRESVRYAAAFDKESDKLPPEGAVGRSAGTAGPRREAEPAPGEVIEVADEVEAFVVAMRDSKLQDAERVLNRLKRAGARARDYVEGLMLDPTPPPIGNVPKPLLHGFLKSLLSRL
jgi:hypothetical protein